MRKFTAKITGLKCVILACMIALSGCMESGPETQTTQVRGDVVVEQVTHKYDKRMDYENAKFRIKKIEYEGHTYLYFLETGYHVGYAGFAHDENCKCRKHVQNN